jgi:translation elongation factor EF-4
VYKDREVYVSNPTEFPDSIDITSKVKEVQEPVVKASIIVPDGVQILSVKITFLLFAEYFGDMMDLCFSHRAEELEHRYLDAGTRVHLQ